MGMLVDGQWTDDDGDSRGKGGKFDHLPTKFHGAITADGSSGFKAEAGRYHFYAYPSCPWAHRVTLFRRLKGLEDVISLSFLTGGRAQGYSFADGIEHTVPGTADKVTHLHQVYTLAQADYTGRCTVPTLWDAKERTIVNNESSEIIRMFNSEFGEFSNGTPDYYPEDLRADIDAVNDLTYHAINNAVYKAGFSTDQETYNQTVTVMFEAFDELEARLGSQRYLCGGRITEADWRLFTTLFRFDAAYYPLFKCNKKHIYEYPNLWNYTRDLYQQPGIAEICDLKAVIKGYYSIPKANPSGVIPFGPDLDFDEPHDRGRFS